jgi:hypothetical protein
MKINWDSSMGKEIKLGVCIVIFIFVVLISIACLNEAFILMSQKSNLDLLAGLLIISGLIAGNTILFRILSRNYFLKSTDTSAKTVKQITKEEHHV